MLRVRTLVVLGLLVALVYWLSPAERKRRIRDKVREIWMALTVAIVLYWTYLLGTLLWRTFKGD